jgi:hypothetical protein
VGEKNCKEDGPVIQKWVWRIRNNRELRELYRIHDMIADIKRRVARIGHVIRMHKTRVAREIFRSKLEGIRDVGRAQIGYKMQRMIYERRECKRQATEENGHLL